MRTPLLSAKLKKKKMTGEAVGWGVATNTIKAAAKSTHGDKNSPVKNAGHTHTHMHTH